MTCQTRPPAPNQPPTDLEVTISSPPAPASVLLDHWPSVDPTLPVQVLDGGTMNDSWLIGRPRHGCAYVLRRHRFTDATRVRREHEAMLAARAGNIPVPRVVATRTGGGWLTEGGRHWTLYEYVSGEQPGRHDLGTGHAHVMGAALGRLHRVLAGAALPAVPAATLSAPSPIGRAAVMSRTRRLIERVASIPSPQPSDHWAYDELTGRLDYLQVHELPEPHLSDASDVQPIHGDFTDSNVIFTERPEPAIAAIIDWDKTERADRAFEVVRAVDLSFDLVPELTAAFIAGYRSSNRLHDAALRRAVETYHARDIRDGLWVLTTLYEGRDERVRRLVKPGGFTPFLDRWPTQHGTC